MTRGASAIVPSSTAGGSGAYRIAIEQTTRVLVRRAKSFRNLIVGVVTIGVASALGAIVARSALGMAGLLLLLPVVGFFFYADTILVRDWRAAILTRWTQRELDLSALRDAIRANPSLPSNTTSAMLATLPRTDSLVAEQAIASPTRKSVNVESRFAHARREDALLLNSCAAGVATIAAIASLWAKTWTPLLALTLLGLRPVVGIWMHHRRRAARDAELTACRQQPGFNEAEYQQLLTGLGG